MSYRICRKHISRTFTVQDHLCKVFLEPHGEFKPGHWLWNVGFAVGKSSRQLNDWNRRKKNRRARSLDCQMKGKAGIKTISAGFNTVLDLRWHIPPGDALVIDCTSGDPEKQFRAFSWWHRQHTDWII
ncbi:hypothetical protein EBT25_06910, partial [bacterium]|nr:hypothetical protein [bacterium]